MRPMLKLASLLLLTVSVTFISCKKNNPAPTQPLTVTSCFDAANNGTYIGNGTASSVPFTNTAVIFTKLSCSSAKIESTKFSTITVSSLTASSPGNYNGTTSTGKSISINFTGNDCSIGGTDLSYSGTK